MANYVAIIGMLNVIVDTVQAVERRSEEAKAAGETIWTGQFKQELAVSIIRGAFLVKNPGGEGTFEAIVDGVKSTISTVVAAFNLLKIFTKKK